VLNLTGQRSAAGGGVVLILRFAVGAVLNYGFGVALAWLLTPTQFGTVSVLQNVQFLCSALLAAGFPWALTAAIAKAAGPAKVAATYRAALLGNLAVGVILMMVFVGVQISTNVVPGASTVTTIAIACMIIALSVNMTLFGALQGERRFDGFGIMQIAEVAFKVVLASLLVWLLVDDVDGVAIGFVGGATGAAAIGAYALRDRLPGRGPVAWRATSTRALSMGVATGAFGVMLTVDVLALSLIGQAHGMNAAHVAVYQAATVLARAPFFVGDALSNAVFPFIAEAPTTAEANDWFVAAYRWVPLLLVPLQLVLLVAPAPVLRLFFPAEYGQAAVVLRILTVGTLGLLSTDMLIKALNARDLAASAARRVPVVLAVEVVALSLAVPYWGTVGAAVAFAVAGWTGALLLGRLYVLRCRPAPPHRRLVGRYLLALVPLVGLLVLAQYAPEIPALIMITLGLGAYAAAAVRLRLVREQDMSRARAMVRRLLPRRRAAVQS
jgi:O-antigen/teichoic acid export membrane protein